MKTNFIGWNNPVINDDTRSLYENLYGENGSRYLAILESSPREIAVISKLIAHLMFLKEATNNGH